MVLQCKQKTILLELLESHAGGSTPEMAIQTRPSTPLLIHTTPFEPADKKRKRDKKGKEVSKEGEVIPSKEFEPQKGAKIAQGAQRKSSTEGIVAKMMPKCRPRVLT